MLTGGSLVFMWIMLIGYIVLMIYIGAKGRLRTKSMADFAIARGRPRPWMMGVCFGATFSSASMFLGVPGLAYKFGESMLWWTLWSFGAVWIGIMIFSKRFWQIGQQLGGSVTLPEWLRIRYGSKPLGILVSFLALFNIFYIIAQTVGIATIMESMMGLRYEWGVVLATAIVVAYVFLGGAYADIYTDVIQGIIMAVVGLLVFLSGIWAVGGGLNWMGNMHAKLAAQSATLVAPFNSGSPVLADGYGLFTFFTMACVAFVLLPHLLNKVLTLKDEGELREFNLSSGITLFFVCNMMIWAGLYARVLQPGLDIPDKAVPVYLDLAFPPFIAAFVAVAVLSAALSTTDGLFVSISSIVGNDLYKKWLAPMMQKGRPIDQERVEKKAVDLAKYAVIALGVATVFGAFSRPKFLTLLLQIGVMAIISGVLAPIAYGYFWRRPSGASAIAAVVSGSGLYLVLYNYKMPVFNAAFVAAVVSAVTMAVVAYLTAPLDEKYARNFFAKSGGPTETPAVKEEKKEPG